MRNLLKRFMPTLPVDISRVRDCKLPFRGSFVAGPFVGRRVLGGVFNSGTTFMGRAFMRRTRSSVCRVHPRCSARHGIRTCFSSGGSRRDVRVHRKMCTLVDGMLFIPSHGRPSVCRPEVTIRGSFVFKHFS